MPFVPDSQTTESSLENKVVLMVWNRAYGKTEGPLICLTVWPLKARFVVVAAFTERNRLVKFQIVANKGVKVIFPLRIAFNRSHPGSCEISLPTATTVDVAASTARFIIYNPLSYYVLHRMQVSFRKVIPYLWQIIVGWIDAGCENYVH